MAKELPGHIAAALHRAGGAGDSAGVPWDGRDLTGPGNPLHDFDGDDGTAAAAYQTALEQLIRGDHGEEKVVEALANVRVFVPIVAELSVEADGHLDTVADKEAAMALVCLEAPDGRKALPAFSSVENLRHWHSGARPVAVSAPRAALSAVAEEAQLMVVDPGADFTFVVRRPAVWALAQQESWTPSYQDPEVGAAIEAIVAQEPTVRRVVAQPGSGVASRTSSGKVVAGGGSGPELTLFVELEQGLDAGQIGAVTARLQSNLSSHRLFAEKVDSLEVRLTGAPLPS